MLNRPFENGYAAVVATEERGSLPNSRREREQ